MGQRQRRDCQHETRDGRTRHTHPETGEVFEFPKPPPGNGETWREKQERRDAWEREVFEGPFKRTWPSTKTCRNAPEDFPECQP